MEYQLYFEEKNEQNFFGIEVLESGKTVNLIPDVSCDKESLEMLVDKLNGLGAEPAELEYIIEDYLTFFDV